MARIRTIKPSFWEDEKIGKLSRECRLFFIGCFTFADDFGFIKGNPVLLKSQIFPYDESLRVSEVKKWIDALVDARMLIPLCHNGESYYVIRTFRSHQVIDTRYQTAYVGKDIVNDVLSSVLHKPQADTPCTHSEHIVDTPAEMEVEMDMDMEREVEGNNARGAQAKSSKDVFFESLKDFEGKYDVQMLQEFAAYWTEKSLKTQKMRFEAEKFFDVARRLATWKQNEGKFASRNTNSAPSRLDQAKANVLNELAQLSHEQLSSESR